MADAHHPELEASLSTNASSPTTRGNDDLMEGPDTSHLCDAWVGDLPDGCQACMEGAKMVLFVTSLCTRRCFYCPISDEKWQADVVYANERFVARREVRGAKAGEAQRVREATMEEAVVSKETLEAARGVRDATLGIEGTPSASEPGEPAGLLQSVASVGANNGPEALGSISSTSSAGEGAQPTGLLLNVPGDHIHDELLTEAELEAVMEEAKAMDALGTGITGGDPMDVPNRVLQVIRALKSRFGAGHHIHMYTSGTFEARYVDELEKAGLDEIRFHPPPSMWERLGASAGKGGRRDLGGKGNRGDDRGKEGSAGQEGNAGERGQRGEGDNGTCVSTGIDSLISTIDRVIRRAAASSMAAGVEVPALPGHRERLEALIAYMETVGTDAGEADEDTGPAGLAFLNLNELEISDTNYQRLVAQGVADQKTRDSYAVAGSEALALELVDTCESPLSIHYCSSAYKDAVQHRQRLIRRARNTAKPYEELTVDGTIIKGIIEVKGDNEDALSSPKAGEAHESGVRRSRVEVDPSFREAREAYEAEARHAPEEAEVSPTEAKEAGLEAKARDARLETKAREAREADETRVWQTLERARQRLLLEHHLAPELCGIDVERRRLEVPADYLEPIASELPWPCFIIEELPIATRLEVERRPLERG